MNITITQLELTPTATGSYKYLPTVYSFDAANINNIRGISIGPYEVRSDRDDLLNKFPKSYRALASSGYAHKPDGDIDFDRRQYYVYFEFQTFWATEVTGDQNEAAIKRRERVIAKIKGMF